MPAIFFWAVPMALIWMLLTGRWAWEGALVGYVFGLGALFLLLANTRQVGQPLRRLSLAALPGQLWAFITYVLRLFLDIFTSGIDVALRIIPAQMRITPSFRRVPVQDEDKRLAIAALSAHAITITPGSLVVDYEEEDGQTVMIVHVLDGQTWTEETLCADQAARLAHLRRILGPKE